jgi:hypothetical protein
MQLSRNLTIGHPATNHAYGLLLASAEQMHAFSIEKMSWSGLR